jgi:hypothetical protein
MVQQPQCRQTGAIASMAHFNESKTCIWPPIVTVNVLSQALPQ